MGRINKDEIFRQGTIQICGSLDINVAVERCYQYLRRFIPMDGMGFAYFDPEHNVFRLIARTDTDNQRSPKILALPEKNRSLWQRLWAESPEINIVNYPERDPGIQAICENYKIDLDASIISLRLELEERRIGVFSLRTPGTGQYTPEHADLIRMLREPLTIAMANALKHHEIMRLKEMVEETNRFLNSQLQDQPEAEIVGADLGLRHVMDMAGQVARLDSPILIQGETGVGKGLIAKAIHQASPRRNRPFVSVNCGAMSDTLLDSELFGHEKGAFTGAVERRPGRFERADKGTIFLDEIGELSLPAQVRLLNVLQNKEIERVGGTNSISLDIRVILATHRNLEQMVKQGRFREDLLYRLNVFPIWIPPLRQRKEDIPSLVHHFIEKKCVELKKVEKPVLGPGAMERLLAYVWPGNVRELQNVVERELIRHQGGYLSFLDLTGKEKWADGDDLSREKASNRLLSLEELNRAHIQRALALCKGKISGPGGAAQLLAIHPNTLRRRMDKLRVPYKRKAAKG